MYVFDSLGCLFLEMELPGHVATPLDLLRTANLLSVPGRLSTCPRINSHSLPRRLHDHQEVGETENFVWFDLAFEAKSCYSPGLALTQSPPVLAS